MSSALIAVTAEAVVNLATAILMPVATATRVPASLTFLVATVVDWTTAAIIALAASRANVACSSWAATATAVKYLVTATTAAQWPDLDTLPTQRLAHLQQRACRTRANL